MRLLPRPVPFIFAVALGAPQAARAQGNLPSEEECLAFAKRVEATMNALDPSFFDASLDMDAMLAKAAEGLGLSEEALEHLLIGAREQIAERSLGVAICAGVLEDGVSYRLLRIHGLDGQPRALFRMAGDDGLNYHDLVLARAEEGGVRIVDAYFFATGELSSDSFRQMLVGLPDLEKAIPGGELPDSIRELCWKMAVIQTASGLAEKGKPKEALGAFSDLPPHLQKDKQLLVVRLAVSIDAGDEEYAEAIALFEKHHPDDPALAMISIDGFVMRKEHMKALVAVNRLDRIVGGDPFLDVVRANIYLEMGKPAQAEALALRAVTREPSLEQTHWALVSARLERKDFPGVVRALTDMEKKLDFPLEGLEEAEGFEEFVKSEEYRSWIEAKKESEALPVGIGPEE